MAKIEVNQVAEILKRNNLDPALLRQLLEEMNRLAEAVAQAEEEKPPAVKKQFVILLSDPEERLPKHDFAGWVLQIPENESVATTQDRIFRSAYDFNASKKGRLLPVKTVGKPLRLYLRNTSRRQKSGSKRRHLCSCFGRIMRFRETSTPLRTPAVGGLNNRSPSAFRAYLELSR